MTIKDNMVSRRTVLKGTAGAAAVAATAGFSSVANAFTNDPSNKSTVKFGLLVPTTGPLSTEAIDEQRGFELALQHINNGGGMLNTMKPLNLKGNGILGKKVEFVQADTKLNPAGALESATNMIDRDGIVMMTGGMSSAVASKLSQLAMDKGVIFMAAFSHANELTGTERSRNTFRYFFNAQQTALALAPVLTQAYGRDRKMYHITADYSWGYSIESSFSAAMSEQAGWTTVASSKTSPRGGDISGILEDFLASGADTLVVNQAGGLVGALKQIKEAGIADKRVNGRKVEVVTALAPRSQAKASGEGFKGVYSTANWNWKLTDKGSQAFVNEFGREYGYPPSMCAHITYVQTLLYADAVERAGTFDPAAVAKALEGHEFDGMGNGPSLYRAEDHQVMKSAVVVRGNQNPTSDFDILEVVEVVDREKLDYGHWINPGELGPYSGE